MNLIIVPKNSFSEKEKGNVEDIVNFAQKILIKNKIPLPSKIYFFNSFELFCKKILPEVKNYGFSKEISKEIIFCTLNHGTYGTINYNENSIVEMNFNPFYKGEYIPLDFLELIIHESLHLYLSSCLNKDINNLKFKFSDGEIVSSPKIIQFDEGYAEFMTYKFLNGINLDKIKKIKISTKNNTSPDYKKNINNFDILNFDKLFENFFLLNREIGLKIFQRNFNYNSKNEDILNFAKNNLKKLL